MLQPDAEHALAPLSLLIPDDVRDQPSEVQPRRTSPFTEEPGYYRPANLWLYGNVRLLGGKLAYVPLTTCVGPEASKKELDQVEREAEAIVLSGKILVCGVHNPIHKRAAVVPLRWGSPRILILSGGFKHHLGEHLQSEPFRAARLWRYQFDAKTDLVLSRRAPEKKPTFALKNPTVDRLITKLIAHDVPGVLFASD